MKKLLALGMLAVVAACAAPGTTDAPAQNQTVTPSTTAPVGEWVVTSIAGQAVPAGVKVDMSFADGKIAGASGCNRYFSGVTMGTDGSFKAAQIAGTMMACPELQMQTEKQYLDVLGAVTRYAITADTLTLTTADGRAIEARRP